MRTIMIRLLNGQRHMVEFDDNETVESYMQRVSTKVGISPESFRVIFCGKQLDAGRTLGEYNIQQETIMHVIPNPPKSALFQLSEGSAEKQTENATELSAK